MHCNNGIWIRVRGSARQRFMSVGRVETEEKTSFI